MAKDRDALRAAIFDGKNKKLKSKQIDFFGEQIEIRQPTLAQVTKLGQASSDDKVPALARILIEYAYIPGTNEKVFDKGDADQLGTMPSGKWLSDLSDAVLELTGVDVKEAEKNSEATG